MTTTYLEQDDIVQRFKVNAFQDSEAAAVLVAFQFGNIVIMEQILVYAGFRRLGIDRELVARLEDWSRSHQATKIVTPIPCCDSCDPMNIIGNWQFFRSMGYHTPFFVIAYKNLASSK